MTSSRIGPFTRSHIAYVAIVGGASLIAVLSALAFFGEPSQFPLRENMAAFVSLLVLAFLSRLMSFRVAGMVTFSLDTCVYVASLLLLGTLPATLLVFVVMLLRGIVELANREVTSRDPWPVFVSIAKLLFGPAVTAAVVLIIGVILDPRTRFLTLERSEVVSLVGLYLLVTALLIVLQYTVVVISYRLNGLAWSRILREVVGPGLLAEAAFIPVGFSLVVVFRTEDPLAQISLSLSYLVFNGVFRRMWLKSDAARQQAEEMALIEEAGRAAASTLDIEEVGRRIGLCLLEAIPEAMGMVLIARGPSEGKGHTYVRARNRTDKPLLYEAVMRSLGHMAQVNKDEGPLTDPLTAISGSDEVGEIIARPMVSPDGEQSGLLALVLKRGFRPTDRERRLVESIARQAAVAVENWRLYSMATVDGLTGLYVRRYLEARLEEEFERFHRSSFPFCILMMDVDELKNINDSYGHAAGDMLLKQVASAIKESVRGMDVPARWGGDEFVILLPEMGLEEGIGVARRILNNLKRKSFVVRGVRITPSASIGVASSDSKDVGSPEDLLAAADRALYQAKRSGLREAVIPVDQGETKSGQ